jgi:NAD(P)-dependent dehydrogenase (short-subunit alcohol dehydrogenase family)
MLGPTYSANCSLQTKLISHTHQNNTAPLGHCEGLIHAEVDLNIIPFCQYLRANAGFLVSGIAEETPIELGRQQLETNFWGTINVTNAVLPYPILKCGLRVL